MSRSVRIRPPAEADIRAAHDWYADQASGLGEEFLRAVDAALAAVQRNPEAYPVVRQDIRRALLRKFPYGIFYVLEPEFFVVIGCLHARRDPTHWDDRRGGD